MKEFPNRYGRITCLIGVKVGDRFMRDEGGAWSTSLTEAKCENVTAKQCVIGGVKYRLLDARELGQHTWSHRGSLLALEPDKLAESRHAERLGRLRSQLGLVKWKAVPDDRIEAIWGLVQGA